MAAIFQSSPVEIVLAPSEPIDTTRMHLLPNTPTNTRMIDVTRRMIQRDIDAEFNDVEQSTIFQCLNDKIHPDFHQRLSSIVRRKLTMDVPTELYRGVSNTTLNMLYKLDVGDSFVLDRVTSFTSDFSIARDFSSGSIYGTQVIFSLHNCPIAFNYKEVILRMLIGMPDSEFTGRNGRDQQIKMVKREEEWMMPIGTKLMIESIEEKTEHLCYPKTIYHLRFISI